jgi:hypothetical protein
MDLARARLGADAVLVRPRPPVRRRPAPRHRHRGVERDRGGSAGLGLGRVRRDRAHRRQDADDRDAGRLLGHARAPRVVCGRARRRRLGRRGRRHRRPERRAGADGAVRLSRGAPHGRSAGLSRSAGLPARAGPAAPARARSRAGACSGSRSGRRPRAARRSSSAAGSRPRSGSGRPAVVRDAAPAWKPSYGAHAACGRPRPAGRATAAPGLARGCRSGPRARSPVEVDGATGALFRHRRRQARPAARLEGGVSAGLDPTQRALAGGRASRSIRRPSGPCARRRRIRLPRGGGRPPRRQAPASGGGKGRSYH